MGAKKVFITGATRGIGRSTALLFAKAGYEVGFCYHERHDLAKSLIEEIETRSAAHSFSCDLADPEAVEKLADAVLFKMGEINVLINNAGVSHYGLAQEVTPEAYERVMNTDLRSAFFLTRAFLPQMIARKEGSIINLSSVWGQTGASCEVLYSTAKAALIGFTKSLAKEVAPSGVRVNCVAPGVVKTDMMARFSDSEIRALEEEIPLCRLADPDEIAKVIFDLAGDDFSYVTGQVIPVNGGFYA